jgi:hypothetical protein
MCVDERLLRVLSMNVQRTNDRIAWTRVTHTSKHGVTLRDMIAALGNPDKAAALSAFSYWGAAINGVPMMRVALAIVLPVCAAIIWGMFISPKARIPTGIYGRVGLGLITCIVA